MSLISAIIIQELVEEAVCLSHHAKDTEEYEEGSRILLEDGDWVEEEEEVEEANIVFLVRMLKEEKSSKLQAAMEKKI